MTEYEITVLESIKSILWDIRSELRQIKKELRNGNNNER